MRKNALLLISLFLLLFLAACGRLDASTGPEPSTEDTTAFDSVDEPQAADFQAALDGQGDLTLELFLENYETARGLLDKGVRPAGEIAWVDPSGSAYNEGMSGESVSGGFYAVSLDQDIFGVSSFFVIPAGLRAMTAEEYLELALASGLSGGELIQPENSWIALQEERALSNRDRTPKECFWKIYLLNDVFRNMAEGTIQPDVPVSFYVGFGGEMQVYTIYPQEEMSLYALQNEALRQYRLLPKEQRQAMLPSEGELVWQDAVDAAQTSIAEWTDQPVKNYTAYVSGSSADAGESKGSWNIALYYEDGGSFVVSLDSVTGTVSSIVQYPDGYFDYEAAWEPEAEPELVFGR